MSKVIVDSFDDITSAADLNSRDADLIATLLNERGDDVLWLPDWLAEEKDLEPVEGSDQVFVGQIYRSSEKAYLFGPPGVEPFNRDWVPKSMAVVFRKPAPGQISTPNTSLDRFGGEHA